VKITDLVSTAQLVQLTYSKALVKIESQKYLYLQNQSEKKGASTVEFFENNPPIKFQLEQISCIATDFNMFDKRQVVDEFTVRVYGRNIKECKLHFYLSFCSR
jgi:hypothetical protein